MDVFSRLRSLNILLIDDDEWIRDSLSLFFENEGCHLETLKTAEQALEFIAGQSCQIIIVDYKLPGMNGLDFLKRIQTTHPNIQRILITAYRNDEVTAEARRLGVDQIIEKPFTIWTIEQCLARIIEA